jgi:type II secretory pathway component PulF
MGRAKQKSQLYHSLMTMEEAGLSRVRALRQRPVMALGRVCAQLADCMEARGASLAQAMELYPRLFTELERNMVAVGETTGRLDTVFGSLSEWFALQHRMVSRVIGGLIYPALVYHVAALLIPLIAAVTQRATPEQAVAQAVGMLAAPWLLLLLAWALRRPLGPPVGVVLLQLPILGGLVHRRNYLRFFTALSLAVKAGVGMPRAVALSAVTCTNPSIRNRLRRVADHMQREACGFMEAFRVEMSARERHSPIPDLMNAGEQTGTTDESATRLARLYQEEAETTLGRLTVILPVLIYLALAAYIGYQIILAYARLLEPVRDLL